jgi:hypothetical protein
MNEAMAKLSSIRHYCFVRGVTGRGADRVGGDDDFRQAFRTINRLYMERKRDALKGQRETQKRVATRRKEAA